MLQSWKMSVKSTRVLLVVFCLVIVTIATGQTFADEREDFAIGVVDALWTQSPAANPRQRFTQMCGTLSMIKAPQPMNARQSLFLGLMCSDFDNRFKHPDFFHDALFLVE